MANAVALDRHAKTLDLSRSAPVLYFASSRVIRVSRREQGLPALLADTRIRLRARPGHERHPDGELVLPQRVPLALVRAGSRMTAAASPEGVRSEHPRLYARWADRAVEQTTRRTPRDPTSRRVRRRGSQTDACTPPVTAESRGYGPTRRTRTVGASYGGDAGSRIRLRPSRRRGARSTAIRPRNPSKRPPKDPSLY